MGKLEDLLSAVSRSAPESKYIRAYHGSPYDFDRFDASKIGTGEGAQAYGRGLYFAGNEDTGRYYRDGLSGVREIKVGGEPVPPAHMFLGQAQERTPRVRAIRAIQQQAVQTDDPIEALRSAYRSVMDKPADEAVRASLLDALNEIKSSGVEFGRRPGHMYEVEIGRPEDSLLDYDRPFSTPVGSVGAEVLRQENPAAISQRTLQAIRDGSWRLESYRGRSPYDKAATELTRLAKVRGGAEALRDAGIPGIRYLDGNSRDVGQGSRNYVMFPGTEDSIRILRKYGIMAPIAAGAMGEE
jgi:hypothetical protein